MDITLYKLLIQSFRCGIIPFYHGITEPLACLWNTLHSLRTRKTTTIFKKSCQHQWWTFCRANSEALSQPIRRIILWTFNKSVCRQVYDPKFWKKRFCQMVFCNLLSIHISFNRQQNVGRNCYFSACSRDAYSSNSQDYC